MGLLAIVFVGLMGFTIFFHISKIGNDVGVQVLTGIVDGCRVSVEERRHILWDVYLGYVGSATTFGFFLALSMVLLADLVDGAGIKLLAYWTAFMASVAGLGWGTLGTAAVFHYRRLLRDAESD
jgi:hypothetical protein